MTMPSGMFCRAIPPGQRFRGIAGAEADTGGDALGQVMDGNGGDEQENLIEFAVFCRMGLLVHAAEPVEMGHQPVKHIHAQGAGKHTGHGVDDAKLSTVFQRGKDQSHHCCRQHNARGEGQNDVAELVGYVLKYKTQDGAENGSAAHTQSC